MTEPSSEKAKPKITELRCPNCGYDGNTRDSIKTDAKTSDNRPVDTRYLGSFIYVEDISCSRKVAGIVDGALMIEGFYETEGFDENGDNPRIECPICYHEFPIPEGLEYDFQ